MSDDAPPEPAKDPLDEERQRAERVKRLVEEESMRNVGDSHRDRLTADWWSSRPGGRRRSGGRLR